MLKKLKLFYLWCYYRLAETKNSYSHHAIAQRQNEHGHAIISYTIVGQHEVYDIPIETLLSNQTLLAKFHPCQAVKFGAIGLFVYRSVFCNLAFSSAISALYC